MRLDAFLHKNGLCESRTRAQNIIKSGLVTVNGKIVLKSSAEVVDSDEIIVKGDYIPYVSRGGLKLEAALDEFKISVEGLIAVDIGASTGGFTDCLLQRGAVKVYAVDCGCGQLHEKLKNDVRVVSLENLNAKTLDPSLLGGSEADIVVMDVSFISQTKLYPAVCSVLRRGGIFVPLIKPQFEVGRSGIGKNGLVTDDAVRRRAVETVTQAAEEFGFRRVGLMTSAIKGGDGNVEYIAAFSYDGKN